MFYWKWINVCSTAVLILSLCFELILVRGFPCSSKIKLEPSFLLPAVKNLNNNNNKQIWDIDRRHAMRVLTGIVSSTCVLTSKSGPVNALTGTVNYIPCWTLENDVQFPTLALNTVGLSSEETYSALTYAIQEGITHVDFHPGKERDGVAKYISQYGRGKHLFLNTKIRKAPPGTSPTDAAELTRQQIEDDLKALNVEYVDMLMLRDSPDEHVIQAQWAVLEQALRSGKTRSIGVINFCEKAMRYVLKTANIKPAVHYHMLHVGMGKDAHGLRTFQESNGIRTFAYGAIGEPGPNQELLSSPVLTRIAYDHGKSVEEVALRWVTQGGAAVSVRPTRNFQLGVSSCNGNVCQEGIRARASSFNWSLSESEMNELNQMTSPDDNPTLFSSSGCPGSFVLPK